MRKKVPTVLMLVVLMSSLFVVFNIEKANAYLYEGTTSGQIYYYNTLVGKYAATVSYDMTGGDGIETRFFPSIEVKTTTGSDGIWDEIIDRIRITVTGTKPNGQPLTSSEFVSEDYLLSPKSSGQQWNNALTELSNVISDISPIGISSLIALAGTSGATLQNNEMYSTGVEYTGPEFLGDNHNKGLQLGYTLHCDPSLGGTYSMNVHFYVHTQQASMPIVTTVTEFDIPIEYEYTPAHIYGSTAHGITSPTVTFTGQDSAVTGYEPNGNRFTIYCSQGGAGYVSGSLNAAQSGQTDIWLTGHSTANGANIYTYVWIYINNAWQWWQIGTPYFISSSATDQQYKIATTTYTFTNIMIVNYNPSTNGMGIVIDCVTTT